MSANEIMNKFAEKLVRNYEAFLRRWYEQPVKELISEAQEIAATKLILKYLLGTASVEDMAYLLRFDNPLEVVRDKWIEENGAEMVHDEGIRHALWSITDTGDAEQDYVLDPDNAPPEKELGVQMLL